MTQSLILGKGITRERVPIHCDDDGNLLGTMTVEVPPPGSVGTPSNSVTAAAAASSVVSAAAAVLFSVTVTNPTENELYLHLFDAAALPANGEVPVDFAVLPANFIGGIDYGSLGRDFATGIVVAVSSTMNSLTVGGDDHLISARFST